MKLTPSFGMTCHGTTSNRIISYGKADRGITSNLLWNLRLKVKFSCSRVDSFRARGESWKMGPCVFTTAEIGLPFVELDVLSLFRPSDLLKAHCSSREKEVSCV